MCANDDNHTGPSVGFISLGCPKNQLDCELMIAKALDNGFELTVDIETADAVVVNTCAFLQEAQSEADEAINEALGYKENGSCHCVVVSGCLPQYLQDKRTEKYPGVDAWLTPDNPADLGEVLVKLFDRQQPIEPDLFPLPQFLADAGSGRVLSTPPSLAYVKIAEGCNHGCWFCIIPKLRGHYRSRTIDDIYTEVAGLIGMGIPEIVLVSQDSSFYGRDLKDASLAGLLKKLDTIEGDFWLRVMYLYPSNVNDELIETWAGLSERILRYFDIPVQHVNQDVLKSMGRRGNQQSVDDLFAKIRLSMPEAVIRTSLIVGYPGETEEQYNELIGWVMKGSVDRLGVFAYSDLPELKSHSLDDHIEDEEKAQRRDTLMEIQYDTLTDKNEELVGIETEVLIEEYDDEFPEKELPDGMSHAYIGRTWRDAYEIDGSVLVFSPVELELDRRVKVRIIAAEGYDLDAEVV